MREIVLGKTGIRTVQNAFGVLPLQRTEKEEAVRILRRAYEGGMRFFDTARVYSNSEEKIGAALSDVRNSVYIASKTQATTPEGIKKDLETSLSELKTDYLDLYQLHNIKKHFEPGDGTGVCELLEDLKRQGVIRHIGATTHSIQVAEEVVEKSYYETLQFPFSYLSIEREQQLARSAYEKEIGFIAMKSLAGGLITRSDAAFAFVSQYPGVLPIWGIQTMSELEDWLSYMDKDPQMTDEIEAFIRQERLELNGEFCRGCGYCMPCTVDIKINNCARMSLMLRRAPSKNYLSEKWQGEMKKIEDCIECGVCLSRCPYGLEIPRLLKKNYEDYQAVLSGRVSVEKSAG